MSALNKAKELILSAYCKTEFESGQFHECYEFSNTELADLLEQVVVECASICYNSGLSDADAHAQNILYEFDIENAKHLK